MLHVLKTEYLGDYTLLCSFDNGEIREVDLTPILRSNVADIAPEWLLQHGKAI